MPATKKPRAVPHAFNQDLTVPRDYAGRRYCADCGKPGADGDPQHPLGALPAIRQRYPDTPPAAVEIDARIMGEETGDAEH